MRLWGIRPEEKQGSYGKSCSISSADLVADGAMGLRAAAAGAAGGGAASMTRSMINSGKPDPVFKRFVEQCLRDKGYLPIGWR